MSKAKGFSLIELLIVVAIILIIAAIAIPNLLKARISSNNSAAAATVRTVSTAETTFAVNYPYAGFASIQQLGPGGTICPSTGPTSANACLIDHFVGCSSAWCAKDAFWYNITLTTADYTISAVPINNQGDRIFCSNGDAVIHVQNPASVVAANGVTPPGAGIAHDTCTALPAE